MRYSVQSIAVAGDHGCQSVRSASSGRNGKVEPNFIAIGSHGGKRKTIITNVTYFMSRLKICGVFLALVMKTISVTRVTPPTD